MVLTPIRVIERLLLCAIFAVSACKLAVMVPSGGDITSASGTRNCTGGSVCEHNITDLTFNECFTAVSRPGYEFSKWQSGPEFLCGKSVSPTCVASNTSLPSGNDDIDAVLAGGSFAYAMPLFDFAGAAAVTEFADANDLALRGHTLVWAQDQYTPAWVKAISDPAELRQVTEEYIATVMGRYAGRIPRWDVVNEPLATLGAQSSGSVWDDLLGPDWIADVFHLAHAADPDAELWINEYGTDWVPGKHQAFLALVAELVEEGVPLHGVGLQTHRISVVGPDRSAFEQQLRDFTNLGLEVAITELDVVTSPTDPTALTSQAEAFRRIVDACLAVASCVEITTWGITDATSWLNSLGTFPAPTRPLLFDDAFVPKAAYFAMRAALAAGRPPSGN